MAVAKFKMRIFADPKALQLFVSTDADVASVISIVADASGGYVVFYLAP